MKRHPELIEETPDAKLFVSRVFDSLDAYRHSPGERFVEVWSAVLAGTGVDRQGDAFAVEALTSMVQSIKQHGLWVRYQHDPAVQPIGRVIDAAVFYDPQSGTHFVAGVLGIYDPSKLPKFDDVGVNVSQLSADAFWVYPPAAQPDLTVTIEFNPHEIPEPIVQELLQGAPPVVSTHTEEQFRKAADPITVLCFSISFSLLAANPFCKKFLETWGESAATACLELAKWIGEQVVRRLKPDARLVFSATAGECELEFVLVSSEPRVVREAVRQMYDEGGRAAALVAALAKFVPQKVGYCYDIERKTWLPAYAATAKLGVIADRPRLIALEQLHQVTGGMSIAGRLRRDATKR